MPDDFSRQRLLDADGVEVEVEYTPSLLGLGRDPDNLPAAEVVAQEVVEEPSAAVVESEAVTAALSPRGGEPPS